jgi:leucyl aminopeptidase
MAKLERRTTVTVVQGQLRQFKADMLVLALFKNTKKVPPGLTSVDQATGEGIGKLLKTGDFVGNNNETALLYTTGKIGCPRILLVGLGEQEKFNLNTLRQAAGTAVRTAERLGAARLGLGLHIVLDATQRQSLQQIGQAISEGAIAGRYDYKEFLADAKNNGKTIDAMRLTLVEPDPQRMRQLKRGSQIGSALAEGQNRTREIANRPGNMINPPSLAREAQRLARQFHLRCRVFDEKKLAALKMNAILAVGSGSASKPRLIVLEYKGRKSNAPRTDVVIVGKAITFDSGGISLKPAANMEAMKFDKSGGCAVLGVLTAAAQLKIPLNVTGVIPAAENLPSQTSYRPGDILRTYNGKTVEILSTDAEGRLLLADALAHAAKLKPKSIIDIATLTGGCVIALGEHHAGLFGNNEDLISQLKQASETSGEKVWPMPCGPEYLEQTQSKIADLKNAPGREGSPCTAAAFLSEFAADIPWAHLDIAGTASSDNAKPYRGIGATGFGVRLLLEYLRSIAG